MAIAGDNTGPRKNSARYRNAKDYIRERLEGEDEPVSPTVLAAEYGCTRPHMSQMLSEMVDAGEVERLHDGAYLLFDETANTSEVDEEDVGSDEPEDVDSNDDSDGSDGDSGGDEGSDVRDRMLESAGEDGEDDELPDGADYDPAKMLVYSTAILVGIAILYIMLSNSDDGGDGQEATEPERDEEEQDGDGLIDGGVID